MLGSGGFETLQLGNGVLGLPLFPVACVNPPMPTTRPPLRPEVPCETQEPPDLNTVPGDPPPAQKVDTGTAAYKNRYEKAKRVAILALQEDLERRGSDVTVLDKEATLAQVEELARRAGNLGQLRALRDGLSLTQRNIGKDGK